MLTTTESASMIQALMMGPLLVLGLSHIIQPTMWINFFKYLHQLGHNGVLIRTFVLEMIPAVAIMAFHQVWTFPAMIISVYGWLLSLKIILSLVAPDLGVRSLAMAEHKGPNVFWLAGLMLITISGVCAWCLWVN